MASRASIARTSARLATSVVVLALGVAAVTAAAVLPLPSVTASVPRSTITPVASPQTLACPGPLVRLVASGSDGVGDSAGTSDSSKVDTVGAVTVVSGATPSGTTFDLAALAEPDAVSTGTALPFSVTAPGTPGVLFGSTQSQQVSDGDLVGLATAACAETTPDSWIAAGSTTTGRNSFLLLTNPTDVASDVTLSIFSETGSVSAPGTSGITVPPKSQRALSLAGFAPDVVSPVIHIVSTGGNVLASLQQDVVRSLTPGGVDIAAPTLGPSLSQTIPGVQIVSTSAIAEQAADPAATDLPAALRVYVPGADTATLTVTLKSETLGVADITANYSATGGLVTDFPFPSLTDDTYSVTVDSDRPVVVGARSAVVSGGVDFATYSASTAISGDFLFTTAGGPSPRLQLSNTSGSDAAVTVTPVTGSPITLTVAANTAAGVAVAPNTVYTVTSTAPLGASVGYLGDGLISSTSVTPASPLASPITVYAG